jgi:hypothetical protein
MLFIDKRACTAPRVLSLDDCPADKVPHMLSDYPIYYDALYFPELHPSVFETADSFCHWLSKAVRDHQCGLHACSCTSLVLLFGVDYIDGSFNVTLGRHSMSLSKTDVELSSFTVCRTIRRLLQVAVVDDSFDRTRHVLLDQNPIWCYRPDPEISRALMELPVPTLIDGVRCFRPDKAVSRLRKNDLVQLIIHDFISRRAALIGLGNADIVALLPDTLCGHRFCAVTHIICH